MPYIPGSAAWRRAMETDEAWSKELVRCYGKDAGDVRYSDIGRGTAGSHLRALFNARMEAQEAWHAEVDG